MHRFVIWILLAAALPAQSTLEQAIALTRQRDYRQARKVLEGVNEPTALPQRILYFRLRGAVASGLGENRQAADEMRSALALSPNDAGLLVATAAAELAAGQLDDALLHARGAGNVAQAQALLGEIHEKRGEFVEAARAYQAAVTLAPDREDLRIALALELVQHQTFQPAIKVLEQAAPLFPKSGRIRTLLGIAHYALGNNEQAISALTDAIQVDPSLEPAYTYLTRIVLESSSSAPPAAAEALCRWNQTVCGAVKLRLAHEHDNETLRAEATKLLEQAPADSVIRRCELGRAYEWANKWQDARLQMERCVALSPTPQNHFRLASVYRQLGLMDLARKEIAARDEAIQKLSQEGARRLEAIQAFRVASQ